MTRKTRLDTAIVVQAAAEMLNTQGAEAFSINRLAEQLGVQPPSLYNHVNGLPGLQRELALMNARALSACMGDAAIGKSGAEALMAMAQAYRHYIKNNSGVYLASLNVTRQPNDAELQAAQQRVVEIALAVMAGFGLQGEDALHAVRGLRSVVHGFATLEVAGGFGLPLDCDESFQRLLRLFSNQLVSNQPLANG